MQQLIRDMHVWPPTCTMMVGYFPNQIVAAWVLGSKEACALVLDNAQLPYLEAYNALFVLYIYNALLQTGLLFMCPIIVEPNANVYSTTPWPRKHHRYSSPCGLLVNV